MVSLWEEKLNNLLLFSMTVMLIYVRVIPPPPSVILSLETIVYINLYSN